MYEHHPVQKQIDSLLAKVGKIRYVEASFGFPHFDNKDDIRYSRTLGGGAILDCLIYPLSFVFRVLGYDFIDCKPTIFYDDQTGVDERGYIHFEYKNAAANISYGFGHSYRNEVMVWGEDAVLKAKRAFSRTKHCTLPIEIWHNGQCDEYRVEKADHFLNMLHSFSQIVSSREVSGVDTLRRLSFIGGIRS